MELNYFVVIGIYLALLGQLEAKRFIGDCSYGFCEQKCKQLEELSMECYCNSGYLLKEDGRKCMKTFSTDDELSGDDASGEEVEVTNCDNEDGDCDKTTKTTGKEITISGDGEDGSGDDSLVKKIIFSNKTVTSSVKYIRIQTTSSQDVAVLKTVKPIKVPPTASSAIIVAKSSAKARVTPAVSVKSSKSASKKPTGVKVTPSVVEKDKVPISSSSKVVLAIKTITKPVIKTDGVKKGTDVDPRISTVYTRENVRPSDVIVVQKPIVQSTREDRASIHKPIKPRIQATSSLSQKPSSSVFVIDRIPTTHIPPPIEETIDEKKVVIQDSYIEDEFRILVNESRVYKPEIPKSKILPGVSVKHVVDKTMKTGATPSVKTFKKIIPVNATRIVVDNKSSTKITKPIDKDSKNILSTRIIKENISVSKTSGVRVMKTISVSDTRNVQKTIKETIKPSFKPKSSFITVSSSLGVVEQTKPLRVLKTVSSASPLSGLPTPTTSIIKDGRTVIVVKKKDDKKFIKIRISPSVVKTSTSTSKKRPTKPPIKLPTESTTEPPTETSTEPPTETPTEATTEPPTEPPTKPPTEATTEPPTEPPTKPPTEPPTKPPTKPLTKPPTEPPTDPPTEPPTEPPTKPTTTEMDVTERRTSPRTTKPKTTERVIVVIQGSSSDTGSESFGVMLIVNKYLLVMSALLTLTFLRF